MNVDDNIDDENINDIFMKWSCEEIFFVYKLILQQNIDDEKNTKKYDMWKKSTYKL